MNKTLIFGLALLLAPPSPAQTPGDPPGSDTTAGRDTTAVVPAARDTAARDTAAKADSLEKADTLKNSSYVTVSVIKSIAGERPSNEFFELRFKFNYSRRFFVLASLDVALSSQGTDTISSEQRRLSDAGAALNWGVPAENSDKRLLFIGVLGKVFNFEPYYGIVVGSTELNRSLFRGTTTMFSLVRRFYSDTAHATYNIFVEIFVRSTDIEFFRRLNIRGGVLLPIRKDGKMESRIAIAVPVVDFVPF